MTDDNGEDKDMNEDKAENQTLGRGLAALFGDDEDFSDLSFMEEDEDESEYASEDNSSYRIMPIEWLEPCPFQPRKHFDQDALKELAESIATHGIIQPLLARPASDESQKYEIIAGERRWRAAQIAQLHEVPVTIQYLTDDAVLELALIENLQREDLSPIEEAQAYQKLIDQFGHTQEKLAASLGKSRSHVANILRLLSLPDSVQKMVNDGDLSSGHARTLVGADNPEQLAKEIVQGGLSVREAEKRKAESKDKAAPKANLSGEGSASSSSSSKTTDTLALEEQMSNLLGLDVKIDVKGKGGVLSISYQNLDQLDDLLHKLSFNKAA